MYAISYDVCQLIDSIMFSYINIFRSFKNKGFCEDIQKVAGLNLTFVKFGSIGCLVFIVNVKRFLQEKKKNQKFV
jgi:hypothetical protein